MAAVGPPAAGRPLLAPQAAGPDGGRVITVPFGVSATTSLALLSIDFKTVGDIKQPDRTGLRLRFRS